MCANYFPSRQERLAEYFAVDDADFAFKPEVFPGDLAPIIRASTSAKAGIACVPACFGMLPHWADPGLARQTYNARSETAAGKPSFRNAWKRRQWCIVPLDAFFEPCYETGKPVRWKIDAIDGAPLGVAGLWEWRANGPDGLPLTSFSMLTINADRHPLMRRFHKPDEEKRMPVIMRPEQGRLWLDAEMAAVPELLQAYPAQLLRAQASPRAAPARQGRRAGNAELF